MCACAIVVGAEGVVLWGMCVLRVLVSERCSGRLCRQVVRGTSTSRAWLCVGVLYCTSMAGPFFVCDLVSLLT